MKKTSLLASVTLIASLGLVGCGGGSSSDAPSQGTSNVAVSGTAIDPELKGATICLDLNQDGNCTENEPSAKTDGNGNFSLTVSSVQLEGSAPLLAIGGIDKESGEAFKGKLFADVNDSFQNITPLTTLAYEKMKENMGKGQKAVQSGMHDMEEVIGLTSNEMQANMIAMANEGNTTTMKVALSLQKSAEAINPKETIQFYKNLSPEMNTSKVKNLTNAILNITPAKLKIRVHSLIKSILDSNVTDPYAMANETRTKTEELGIDQDEMMDEMPNNGDDMPDNGDNMPGNGDNVPGKGNSDMPARP